jgi:hypothetical protein
MQSDHPSWETGGVIISIYLWWNPPLGCPVANGLQQAPWDAFDRLLANKPELDCPSSHFSNNRISPEKPVWANLGSQPREVCKMPDGLPIEERQGSSGTQASQGVLFLFVAWPSVNICRLFGIQSLVSRSLSTDLDLLHFTTFSSPFTKRRRCQRRV